MVHWTLDYGPANLIKYPRQRERESNSFDAIETAASESPAKRIDGAPCRAACTNQAHDLKIIDVSEPIHSKIERFRFSFFHAFRGGCIKKEAFPSFRIASGEVWIGQNTRRHCSNIKMIKIERSVWNREPVMERGRERAVQCKLSENKFHSVPLDVIHIKSQAKAINYASGKK